MSRRSRLSAKKFPRYHGRKPVVNFIVIESIDAGGGSTQAKLLASQFKKHKYTVHQYHFPQEDRATGQIIYQKFLHNKNKLKLSRREQALLYLQDFFSRAEDIRSQLTATGKHAVISDRYYTSTLAYQTIGLTGQRRRDTINWIKTLARQGKPALPKPDMVIFLNTPIDVSLGHLKGKRTDHHENRQKLSQFHRSYSRLAQEENWVVINSVNDRGEQRSAKDIHHELWSTVQKQN